MGIENENREDRNAQIHDCYYEIYNISLSDVDLDSLANKLPNEITEEAKEWGWYDTVVGDKIFKYLKDEYNNI
ncbi:hypothetical protein ACI3ER_12055 [Bacillus sp. Wb]